ncbi:MAG: hypothetical protein KC933_38465 [Myxococcales bacterium]|nr:hypothetical protein [Myxococcales bacterium]MCB9651496.1 hypothetical protein [Deltaproteobacteria bacterium]
MRSAALLILALTAWACGDATPAPGTPGGACLGDGTCNGPLECRGGTCVAGSTPDAGQVDSGTTTATTGAVAGTVSLAGEASHAGVELLIAGRRGTTDATGAYRIDGVPAGVHALEARIGPTPGSGRVEGRVVASTGTLPEGVQVLLQVAPSAWAPHTVDEVTVTAGRTTDVEPMILAHLAPVARYARVDTAGSFSVEVPAGHYIGARPQQPEVGTDRFVQPVGTFAVAAGTYPFAGVTEGEDPPITGLGFTWDFEDAAGLSADPAWAWGRPLDVGAAPAQLGALALYPGALLLGTEEQPLWFAGLDMSSGQPVKSDSPDADLLLGDANGPFAPTRTVRLIAPGIRAVDAPSLQAFLQAPTDGYAPSLPLTYQTFAGVFEDAALDQVYAVRTLEGDYAKLKVRYGLQGTGADNVWSAVFVLYHHEPGGSPAFSR